MKKLALIAAAGILAASLAACGGSSSEAPAESTSVAGGSDAVVETSVSASGSVDTAAAGEDLGGYDFSAPTVEIMEGDYDGIQALAKQMQNFEVEEGTVIKVTGLFVKETSTPSIMEQNSEGTKIGMNIYLPEGTELPPNDTLVEATGVAVKGQYFMEFHVPADQFVVFEGDAQ